MAIRSSASREALRRMAEVVTDATYALDPRTWRTDWPRFQMSQADDAVGFFDEHGWVIFRDVFAASEILAFRRDVERLHQTSHAGDLLSSPDLGGRRVVLDERVLQIAKTILRAAPCYFGDSTASIDVGAMGFHKDNPDREEARAPDWRSPYTLIRMGVYLQDHTSHSGGLAVRDRSHRAVNRNRGRPLAIPSQVGDVVVWSLRTTRSGYAARLNALPRVFVPIPVVKVLGASGFARRHALATFFRPLEGDKRLAMFVTFGIGDEHQTRYLTYLQTRKYAVDKWRATMYGPDAVEDAAAGGVKLISMREHVSGVEVLKLNTEHVELPW